MYRAQFLLPWPLPPLTKGEIRGRVKTPCNSHVGVQRLCVWGKDSPWEQLPQPQQKYIYQPFILHLPQHISGCLL